MSINEIYRNDKHEDIPNPLSSCSRAPLTPSSLVRRPPAALSTAITVFTHFRNKQKHVSNTTSTLCLLARPFFPRTADNHQQTARRNNGSNAGKMAAELKVYRIIAPGRGVAWPAVGGRAGRTMRVSRVSTSMWWFCSDHVLKNVEEV